MSKKDHQRNTINNKSCNTTNFFDDKNIINNEESLLLKDVYGRNSDSCEENLNGSSNSSSNDCNNTSDFSALFNNFFKNSSPPNNTSNDFNMPDIETMLKFKKIFESLNSKSTANDPMINLLYAIKPFIQGSKKSIIDQIAKFMTISTVLQDLNGVL